MSIRMTRPKTRATEARRGSTELTPKTMDISSKILEELQMLRTEVRKTQEDLQEWKEDIKSEFKKEIREVKVSINKISSETKQLKGKVLNLEKDFDHLVKCQEEEMDALTLLEVKEKESCLRFRGIMEKNDEKIRMDMINILAPFLEMGTDRLDLEINRVYRVNSRFATQKKLPRDIIVYFTRKAIRDQVLQKNSSRKLKVDESFVTILKEVPLKVLRKRRDYFGLVEILRHLKINFRWERIEGLSFVFQQKRWRVDSISKAKEIMKKLKKWEDMNVNEGNLDHREKKVEEKEQTSSAEEVEEGSEGESEDELEQGSPNK